MIGTWERRLVVDAWARRIGLLLSAHATGFRDLTLEEETVTVRFGSHLDAALAFPLFAAGVKQLPPGRMGEAYRINPAVRNRIRELGFQMATPVREGDYLLQIGEGSVGPYAARVSLAATRFTEGFPTVYLEITARIEFREEDHCDLMLAAARVMRAGRQLGEYLETEEAAAELVSGPEAAALHGLWGRWNELWRDLVASRVSAREDFAEHVELRHDLTLEEVYQALANQVADPAPEGRRAKLQGRGGDAALRRTSVLGITDGGRVIEVVLESRGGRTAIVTAYRPGDESVINWWVKRGKGGSSNARLEADPEFRKIYKRSMRRDG